MELSKVLHTRQSVRSYTNVQIPQADLVKILEAAQTSPLAAGDNKTTHITVVRDEKLLGKIRQACALKSRKDGKYIDALYGAQTMIFVSAGDISDDHIEYCNAACIIENIMLQATELKLGSTYIWGCLRKLRQYDDIIAKLNLPEGYEILSAVVIGYPVKPLEEREKKVNISVDII